MDGGAKHRPLYMHQATTKRLESGCKYQYQVGSQSPKTGSVEWSPIFEFHTASSSEEFEFLITGDLVCCIKNRPIEILIIILWHYRELQKLLLCLI